MNAHPRDHYRSLMADRSCSQDDARRTPSLAEAHTRSRATAFVNPPVPHCHRQERQRQMTFDMYNLAKLAHVLYLVSGGEKGLVSILQKNGTLWSQQPDQVLGDLFRNLGLVRGTYTDPGGSVGLTRGLSSKPGTSPKLLCSDWSLYHEF